MLNKQHAASVFSVPIPSAPSLAAAQGELKAAIPVLWLLEVVPVLFPGWVPLTECQCLLGRRVKVYLGVLCRQEINVFQNRMNKSTNQYTGIQ